MRICVFGCWHLGSVTAACLAAAGHRVIGLDPDAQVIGGLRAGKPPLFEPGLDTLIASGLASGGLSFEVDPATAVHDIDVLWITFDTPVDDDDVAQPHVVNQAIERLIPLLHDDCLVIVSSQLPVGSTRRLAKLARQAGRDGLGFVYSPENLRLGQAIEVFTHPDRIVIGLERAADRTRVEALLAPLSAPLLWMSLESAEMTKHAINAFLATSITFMNEIARICEHVGADAKEVEQGLKSEARIGPRAYLSPGAAFAGGTLARDVTTLAVLAGANAVPAPLVTAIRESNDAHRQWALGKLEERLGALRGKTVAILGLTYKPGTSTLRRSSAIELAQALAARGARVIGYDPAIEALPPKLATSITLVRSAAAAVEVAEGIVVATPWPEFRDLDWEAILRQSRPVVVDAGGFVATVLQERRDLAYAAVGQPWSDRKEMP